MPSNTASSFSEELAFTVVRLANYATLTSTCLLTSCYLIATRHRQPHSRPPRHHYTGNISGPVLKWRSSWLWFRWEPKRTNHILDSYLEDLKEDDFKIW